MQEESGVKWVQEEDVATKHVQLNQKKWDSWAPNFDKKRYGLFRYYQKSVISLAQVKASQNFLDVGCGTGWAVLYAAHLLCDGGKAFGIDLSPKMIEKAKENGKEIANAEFYVANAEEMPFDENFFDRIICTNSFHHYLHPDVVLAEIRRILKPGGRVFILDPVKDTPIMRLVNTVAKKIEPEHVNLYNLKEIRTFFDVAHLKYVATKWHFYLRVRVREKDLEPE
jgi:ubiquinone/menaquinone biosynthesis C-methylase UbiE